ncbi:MAG: nucleoside hydrolase [Prolixibacteraceae bacterium]|nr:nucleoside hydrolase [Prolixibacteraceae bacterium]
MNRILHYFFIAGLFLIFACTSEETKPVKIIFDTDFGGDADDLGALVMLHNFVENNECELLAVMLWTSEQYAVQAVDAINRYYNHPDIPIGVRKAGKYHEPWNYCKPIADAFPNELTYEKAEDATILYRKILAEADDNSVVIVPVGPLANLQNLIVSPPDAISPLTGKELLHQKVKELVIMGGQFPSGENEWNFNGNMPGVTKFVLNNIDLPVTFSGYEIGAAIKTGEEFNQTDPNTPLYVGFKHFSQHAPWINENYKGKILDNSTFDQTAVLHAVRNGEGQFWEKVTGGECIADENGGNTWAENPESKHAYLKLIADPENMAALIEKLMLWEPENR